MSSRSTEITWEGDRHFEWKMPITFGPAEFDRLLKKFIAKVPEVAPEKFNLGVGRWTPYAKERFLSLLPVGLDFHILVVRRKKPRLQMRRPFTPADCPYLFLEMYVRSGDLPVSTMVELFRIGCIEGRPIDAQIDQYSAAERAYQENVLGIDNGVPLGFNAWDGICQLPWLFCFGAIWIKHFGLKRILSCPAYRVEHLAEDQVMIQLVEDYQLAEKDWPRFQAARLAAQEHLGRDSFYTEWNAVEGRRDPTFGGRGGVRSKRIPPEIWLHPRNPSGPATDHFYRRRPDGAATTIQTMQEVVDEPKRFVIIENMKNGRVKSRDLHDLRLNEIINLDRVWEEYWIPRFLDVGIKVEQRDS